jgi:heme/copper-type cytochrome/quinol oxidase subunit 2
MLINIINKLFLGFSEPATPIMEGIIDFHNYIFFFLVLILVFVLTIMCNILIYFWYFFENPTNKWDILFRDFIYENNKVTHGTVLEIIWTTLPALILITIAFPSFSLLYSMDEVMLPAFTLKVIGHQWYWSYEYTDQAVVDMYNSALNNKEDNLIENLLKDIQLSSYKIDLKDEAFLQKIVEEKYQTFKEKNSSNYLMSLYLDWNKTGIKNLLEFYMLHSSDYVNKMKELIANDGNNSVLSSGKLSIDFDSYMVPESDLNLGDHRLLEVTEHVVLPINTYIRILVSSADVLHSFAVPSLGIKADAVPGRLNQMSAYIKRQGVFYGQCSELCGVSHGMMPITVRAVNLEDYVRWLLSISLNK